MLAAASSAAAIGVAVPLFAAPKPAERAAPAGPALRRGGSIHTMMNWAAVEPGNAQRYAWPPFASPGFAIDAELLGAFRKCGLDHIRMTVDPGPFLQATGQQTDELCAILVNRCREILARDLDVVVDFHPTSQVIRFAPERIVADMTSTSFQAYVAALARVAEALKVLGSERVALELMNEPPYGYDIHSAARWQRMATAMHQACRKSAPDLTLVVSGAAGGGLTGLLAMDARSLHDAATVWTFHSYDPHPFTHQGVVTSQSNMLHFRYLAALAWPAQGTNVEGARELIAARIDADPAPPADREKLRIDAFAALARYVEDAHGPRVLQNDFSRVETWAATHGVPNNRIYLGEFGAMRETATQAGARAHDREAWLRAVRTAAERRGFGWALWDINDTQMGLVERKNSPVFHDGTLNALGLTMPRA